MHICKPHPHHNASLGRSELAETDQRLTVASIKHEHMVEDHLRKMKLYRYEKQEFESQIEARRALLLAAEQRRLSAPAAGHIAATNAELRQPTMRAPADRAPQHATQTICITSAGWGNMLEDAMQHMEWFGVDIHTVHRCSHTNVGDHWFVRFHGEKFAQAAWMKLTNGPGLKCEWARKELSESAPTTTDTVHTFPGTTLWFGSLDHEQEMTIMHTIRSTGGPFNYTSSQIYSDPFHFGSALITSMSIQSKASNSRRTR